ncbi:MAG: nucleoside phosphorylase [Saprospiraceae bacterium]|nr:nucleoside phosphorylase [Saprospiraceae bacterium]
MDTQWIFNKDGSIYHLKLSPDELATFVFTVGDPSRVASISQHFDVIELKKTSREFVTHTGWVGSTRVSVISTGIGTDNMDIVLNEMDVLWNLDINSFERKPEPLRATIIRLGTSGAIQPDIAVGTTLVSDSALGLDSLHNFYKMDFMVESKSWDRAFKSANLDLSPYFVRSDENLLGKFKKEISYNTGLTLTAPGFYGPQGRISHIPLKYPMLLTIIGALRHSDGTRISNFEMETSGLYALGRLLGHHCLSINAILANRITNQFSKDPEAVVDRMIRDVFKTIF